MDALKNLSANIPDWLARLEELSDQIEQRQVELARFAKAQQKPTRPKSLKNKGSTESLRPTDETHTTATTLVDGDVTPAPQPQPQPQPQASPPISAAPDLTSAATAPEPQEPSSLQQPTPSTGQPKPDQVLAPTRTRIRKNIRKRIRTDSVISAGEGGEGGVPKYRCRGTPLVYYDSYVQSFFEDLVKFVSASRNLMRKAKMAAKVAQIKRMAEMEVPDDDEDDDDDGITGELKADTQVTTSTPGPLQASTPNGRALEASPAGELAVDMQMPPLNYVSTRAMRAYVRTGSGAGPNMLRPTFARAAARGAHSGSGLAMLTTPQVPDAFDALDKGLDFVQATCEQAAHQFLRDGDCDEEIAKLKTRLVETAELAAKEMERKLKEDPDVGSTPEPTKSRSYRLQSMRRESASSTNKDRTSSPPPLPHSSHLVPASPLSPASLDGPPSPLIPASPKPCGGEGDILQADMGLEADGATKALEFNARDAVDYRVLSTVH